MSQPTTAYYRLQAQLEKIIKTTPNGEKLPSEPKLANTLKVSRATLREAMRIYEVQGLIRRKQGIGTFVVASPQIIETGLEILESIETLAEHSGMDITMGDLEITNVKVNANLAEILNLSVGAALITIKRIIKADNRPVAFLIDTLPEDILSPADLDGGFTGSVLDLLLHRGNPTLSISKTEISASPAPTEVARALEIQRGDTLLLLSAHLFTNTARVIDISYSYFLPGYFNFHVVRKVGHTNQIT